MLLQSQAQYLDSHFKLVKFSSGLSSVTLDIETSGSCLTFHPPFMATRTTLSDTGKCIKDDFIFAGYNRAITKERLRWQYLNLMNKSLVLCYTLFLYPQIFSLFNSTTSLVYFNLAYSQISLSPACHKGCLLYCWLSLTKEYDKRNIFIHMSDCNHLLLQFTVLVVTL